MVIEGRGMSSIREHCPGGVDSDAGKASDVEGFTPKNSTQDNRVYHNFSNTYAAHRDLLSCSEYSCLQP